MKLRHVLLAAGLVLGPGLASAPATHARESRPLARSLWVWDAALLTETARQPEFFRFCKEKNISVLYASVGDIFSERKRPEGDPRHVTPAQLGAFLQAAHRQGLQVEALDGDPSFALAANHEKTLARMRNALAYNRSAPADQKLDGWQWDTEPYLLPEYRNEATRQQVLQDYLTSARQMCDAVRGEANFRLGYAIPSFFDAPSRAAEWNGVTKPVGFHLMDLLNTIPAGYVALMSYRDKAEGNNGTIAISRDEVVYAEKSAPRVRVWIGQETGKQHGTDPASITFYQEGEDAMETELQKVQTAFAGSPVVGGLAIHHWASYRTMTKGPRETE